MMVRVYLRSLLVVVAIFIYGLGIAQKTETIPDSSLTRGNENKGSFLRIMFYNCENFFDTQNDPNKNDESFLPEGDHHWTPDKYWEKAKQIAKVITAVGGWDPPGIVGFCEVENAKVLEDLTKHTPLSELHYNFIHFESGDFRGIDVAMLYRKEDFVPLFSRPLRINFKEGKPSRDILYVKGVTSKKDTLHVFVNHWPSKFGGEMESEPKRLFVGNFLKQVTDSIFTTNALANIIIMGDLNDGPENNSVAEALNAKIKYEYLLNSELYNLSYYLHYKKGMGSHKFQGEWSIIDNLIVSGALLGKKNSIYTTPDDAHIFNAPFLMEKDEREFGFKPYRTYLGMTYIGGFSDHLPTYLDLHRRNLKK